VNALSLFAGIGGLELGLERAGMTVVGQVEIDPFCRQVLAKHWPEVPRHDDVRTAVEWWLGAEAADVADTGHPDGRRASQGGRDMARDDAVSPGEWAEDPVTSFGSGATGGTGLTRPTVDVICGGFPCQDISNAGKREGITGARSGLWSAMRDTVRALRPRYVVMENVSAILVRGLDVVAADLAEIGYDLEWDCIPAAAVGAPHRRDRWWGIAYPQRDGVRLKPVTELGRSGADVVAADGTDGSMADTASIGRGQGRAGRPVGGSANGSAIRSEALADTLRQGLEVGHRGTDQAEPFPAPVVGGWWAVEPDVGRVAHGIPRRVDRLRSLGNAVVPQVAEHIGGLVMAAEMERAA
jgi:DNA (cytosine-5)-methyltransferase 1